MAPGGRQGGSGRTADDRARAAAERAARRTERAGRPVPAPPEEVFAHPGAVRAPDHPIGRPDPDRSDAPAAYHPSAHASEPQPTAEPAGDDPRALTAVEDRPLPPRRVPSSRRTAAPRRVPPGRASGAPRPRRAPSARRGGAVRTGIRRLVALLSLALIGAALYAINATFQPFHGDATGRVGVTIPEGADAGDIGALLADRGVVDSALFFQLNATLTGRRGGLRAGEYTLQRNMSHGDAIDALMKGPRVRVVPTIDITVPEGPSIREAARALEKGPLKGDYERAARSRRVLRRIRRLGAPRGTRNPEGFLFPATYTLLEGARMRDFVDRQLDAFKKNFGGLDLRHARRRNLTRYDVLIIASMVERETQVARERPIVASVIYNRLQRGIPLGIDATTRYETGNWTRPIRVSELEAETPYNTRLRPGLPPTPIGNPGLASMRAAARPRQTDYIFYVRKPGKSGEHAFSETNAEFERDVARYQASRGGP